MSTPYAGTAKLATTTPLADANSPFNPSAVNAPIATNRDSIVALTDNGFYATTLNAAKPPYPLAGDHVNTGTYKLGASSGIELATARLYSRIASSLGLYAAAVWQPQFNQASLKSQYKQLDIVAASNADGVTFFWELPNGIILKRVSLRIEPDSGHVGKPATMPVIEAYLANNITGTVAGLGGKTDDSVDTAAYNLPHSISRTLADVPFDAGIHSFFLTLRGEAGGDSMSDMLANLPFVEFTRAGIGQEFGALVP